MKLRPMARSDLTGPGLGVGMSDSEDLGPPVRELTARISRGAS